MKIFFKILALLLLSVIIIILIAGWWLKTDNAQITINNKLSDYLEENIGLSIKLENIHLSFPLKLNIGMITVSDQEAIVGNIKNLKINVLMAPSIFHEITINSIKANELNLFKMPIIKTNNNELQTSFNQQKKDSFFNPNIIIKKINIAKINIEPSFSGASEIISINLNTNINYKSHEKLLNYELKSQLLSFRQNLIHDAQLNLMGDYNIKDEQLLLKIIEFTSEAGNITGNLTIDQISEIISGEMLYQSNIITKLIAEKWSNHEVNTDGKLIISGNIKQPSFNINGKFLADNPNDFNEKLSPIFYVSRFNLDENANIFGKINLKYDSLETNGEIVYVTNKLFLNNFVTTGNNLISNLDLALDMQTYLLNGKITLKDDNLNEFTKYFPELYSGTVDIKADFSMNGNKQQIFLSGNIKDFASSYGSLELLMFDINSSDIMSMRLNNSNILMHNLDINDIILNEIKLNAQSINNILTLKTSIISKTNHPFNFDIISAVELINDGNIKLNISQLTGKIDQSIIKNTKNLSLSYGDNISFNIDKIQIDKGDVSLVGDITKDKVSAHGNINNVSTKLFEDFLSEQFKASIINGKINLSGSTIEPILTSEIKITDILTVDENKKFSLNFNSTTNHIQTDFTANANLFNKKIASVTGTVKNTFLLSPFKFMINSDQDLMINANFTEQFNILSLLPEYPGQKIEGVLNGNVKVIGTPENPIIKGNLKLIDGKYVYKSLGIKFKNITSDIIADGYKVTFSQIKAQDTFNNLLQGSGKMDLKNFSYFFTAETPKFNPINTPYIHGDVSGNITIDGNYNNAKATGNLTLGPAEIKIPEHFKQNIPELNIVEVAEIDENSVKYEPYEVNLKVNLITNDKVFVRGWGVDTRLDGNLKISGNLSKPNIKGVLHSVKGRYKEFGKVLNIKEGILTFDGPIMPSPYLNIVGETNVGDNEIRIILAGSIASPEIRLESTPDMTEERALSMLLFGTDTENISAFQALQLADSARRLSGKGGNFDPLGMSRKILGVDDISLKTDADDPEKVSIGVGKYLTDKIYFEIEQGQQADTTKTRVEIQLTPKISIENVIEQQGNTSLGVNWRFDY